MCFGCASGCFRMTGTTKLVCPGLCTPRACPSPTSLRLTWRVSAFTSPQNRLSESLIMMKTTEIKDIVSYLLKLFGSIVLLVGCPLVKKGCKGVDFRKVSLKDMMDPDYRLKLAQGNIGVVLGDDSSGLASL